jgi:hypothetical protein
MQFARSVVEAPLVRGAMSAATWSFASTSGSGRGTVTKASVRDLWTVAPEDVASEKRRLLSSGLPHGFRAH